MKTRLTAATEKMMTMTARQTAVILIVWEQQVVRQPQQHRFQTAATDQSHQAAAGVQVQLARIIIAAIVAAMFINPPQLAEQLQQLLLDFVVRAQSHQPAAAAEEQSTPADIVVPMFIKQQLAEQEQLILVQQLHLFLPQTHHAQLVLQ